MGTVISQTQSWELEYGLGKPGEYTVPLEEVMFPPQGTAKEGTQTQMSVGDHPPPENSDDSFMKCQHPAPCSRRSGGMGRGDGAEDDRAWSPPPVSAHHSPSGP